MSEIVDGMKDFYINTSLIIVALLLLKHYIADFVLQTAYQLDNKGKYGHWGGVLHASIHMIGTFIVVIIFVKWPLAVIAAVFDGFVHYHIDWVKEKVNHHYDLHANDHRFWVVLGADQFLHQLTYIFITGSLSLFY